jgi:hypothetical protein
MCLYLHTRHPRRGGTGGVEHARPAEVGDAGEHMAETATSRAALLPLSLPTWLDPLAGKEVDRSVRVQRKEEEERAGPVCHYLPKQFWSTNFSAAVGGETKI